MVMHKLSKKKPKLISNLWKTDSQKKLNFVPNKSLKHKENLTQALTNACTAWCPIPLEYGMHAIWVHKTSLIRQEIYALQLT